MIPPSDHVLAGVWRTCAVVAPSRCVDLDRSKIPASDEGECMVLPRGWPERLTRCGPSARVACGSPALCYKSALGVKAGADADRKNVILL